MKEFCVDLEIAKELKENGYPQKSIFKWCEDDENYPTQWLAYDTSEMGCTKDIVCSGPFGDELLKELPEGVKYIKGINRMSGLYYISFELKRDEFKGFNEKKASNALAKLWLYLKKEGCIK